MNPSESQGDLLQGTPTAKPSNPLAPLQAQCDFLRSLLVVTLIALILLSFGVILFIGRQMVAVRAQLDASGPETRQMIAEFKKHGEPLLRSFVGSLQLYASTNRDFDQTLEKYRTPLYRYFAKTTPATPPPVPKTAPK